MKPGYMAVIGVDGTGTGDEVKYKKHFEKSFVNRIVSNCLTTCRTYRRGPGNLGLGSLLQSPDELAGEILQVHKQGYTRIFMTGFSRGGAIVINASAILKKSKIDVEALFLFDAVDRSIRLEARTIPSNVKHCYHAIRLKEAGSRETFGNCGREAQIGVDFRIQPFLTTHGGMGGTPWEERGLPKYKNIGDPLKHGTEIPWASQLERRTVGLVHETFPESATNLTMAQELNGSNAVWLWMYGHLQAHGVMR